MRRGLVLWCALLVSMGMFRCKSSDTGSKKNSDNKEVKDKREEKPPEKRDTEKSRINSPEARKVEKKPKDETKPGQDLYEKYLAYEQGNKVKQSEKKSMKYLRLACEAGHLNACSIRIEAIARGDINVDKKFEFLKELKKLCEKKNRHSCFRLALEYKFRAEKVSRKKKKQYLKLAHEYNKLACEMGRHLSCIQTAYDYRLGAGVKKDKDQAEKWYKRGLEGLEKACKDGDYLLCEDVISRYSGKRYSMCSYPWRECERDEAKLEIFVQHLLRGAREKCKEGKVQGCSIILDYIAKYKFIDDGRAKKKKAMNVYLDALRRSCAKKHGTHCLKLGKTLRRMPGREERKEALEVFSRACDQGLSTGCYYKKRGL